GVQEICVQFGRSAVEKPDHRHHGLLRPRRNGPRRRPAEQRDELAPPHHSITSSARCCNSGGTSSPSTLAVLRFIARWYLTGYSTGSSLGFAPLRMRST